MPVFDIENAFVLNYNICVTLRPSSTYNGETPVNGQPFRAQVREEQFAKSIPQWSPFGTYFHFLFTKLQKSNYALQ